MRTIFARPRLEAVAGLLRHEGSIVSAPDAAKCEHGVFAIRCDLTQ
jgi:hypothetical protein